MKYQPLELKPMPCENGWLWDAGQETFARLHIQTTDRGTLRIYYGESMEEIMDNNPNMWLSRPAESEMEEPARAFRYLRIAAEKDVSVVGVSTEYESLGLEKKGDFSCDNAQINRI